MKKAKVSHEVEAYQDTELADEIRKQVAGDLGVSVDDLPTAARLLRDAATIQAVAAIPDLDPDKPQAYIAAVARLIGIGVLTPERGKTMLYACQLCLAASRFMVPPEAPRQRQILGLSAVAETELFPPEQMKGLARADKTPNGFDAGKLP